jgi:hypothetical protein
LMFRVSLATDKKQQWREKGKSVCDFHVSNSKDSHFLTIGPGGSGAMGFCTHESGNRCFKGGFWPLLTVYSCARGLSS